MESTYKTDISTYTYAANKSTRNLLNLIHYQIKPSKVLLHFSIYRMVERTTYSRQEKNDCPLRKINVCISDLLPDRNRNNVIGLLK